VDGETLADRIAGRSPLTKAGDRGQIAEALEARTTGIVPQSEAANIALTHDGNVRSRLDWRNPPPARRRADELADDRRRLTGIGVILETAAYMS
jgi:hypothetical protein